MANTIIQKTGEPKHNFRNNFTTTLWMVPHSLPYQETCRLKTSIVFYSQKDEAIASPIKANANMITGTTGAPARVSRGRHTWKKKSSRELSGSLPYRLGRLVFEGMEYCEAKTKATCLRAVQLLRSKYLLQFDGFSCILYLLLLSTILRSKNYCAL